MLLMINSKSNITLINKYKKHRFHLVSSSPWPFFTSIMALLMTLSLVMLFHSYEKIFIIFFLSVFCLIILSNFWFRDIIREATFLGDHTTKVQLSIRFGFILFIVSEIMFFFSFFWAFFHSSFAPTFSIGDVWPPFGITLLDPLDIPLLNTGLLLLSGAAITWSHHCLLNNNLIESFRALILTIFLGVLFTEFQFLEYLEASFDISDSIYGSTFFILTGFHGMHVLIGTIFLFVCLIRLYLCHFSKSRHFGYEAAAWYWHFVDVVWLFLYITIYWWSWT